MFCVSSDIFPEVRSLDQKAILLLVFEVFPYLFPQWLHQSPFPPTVQKGSLFSTFTPALATVDLSMIAILTDAR